MNIKLNIDGIDYSVTPTPPPLSSTGLFLVPPSVTPCTFQLTESPLWKGTPDEATSGTATLTSTYPVTIGGRTARKFQSVFTNNSGARFSCVYDSESTYTPMNFVYSGSLFIDGPQPIGQMELDNNEVDPVSGDTYIFGVQQNINSGSWDVTSTDRTVIKCEWHPTQAKGSPANWPTNMWLPFEIASHRDNYGVITYDAVRFNGTTQPIQAIYPASLPLKWAKGIKLVNFQIGGKGTGTVIIYASNLQITCW